MIITMNENYIVTRSCKNCYKEIKELDHKIISKEEYQSYLEK